MKILVRLLFLEWVNYILDIILDRLRREFKVECNQGAPQVAYKEQLVHLLNIEKFIKSNQVVEVNLLILYLLLNLEMLKSRFEFFNKIKGGNIPKEYIPSVEKGFKDAMNNGVLAGYPS